VPNASAAPSASPPAGRRNVVTLGVVSLLNDMAAEMVYPIIPIFLTTVLAAPVAIVGLIEGIAEATASVLKVFSGWLSDRFQSRKRFVTAGYTLAAVAKILLALAAAWPQVLLARFVDRAGKGVRTAARDALIADSTASSRHGAAFGLHRGLDTAGAVLGPLLGLALLHVLQNDYRTIFMISAIPALLAVLLLIALVREPQRRTGNLPAAEFLKWRQCDPAFKKFLLASALFALGNSSDAFLILRAQALGYSTSAAVLLFVIFNVVYALLAFPLGKLADRLGARPLLAASFLLFAVSYAGFGLAGHAAWLWLLFPLYGVYMAMSEGVGKAYIAGLVPAERRGTALGLFYTVTGVIMLLASTVAGLLWSSLGPPAPFYFGAVLALLACVVFVNSK